MYNKEIGDSDLPLLEWNGFSAEIKRFYTLHKDLIDEVSGEETTNINETAQNLFIHLICDYARDRDKSRFEYDLTYRIAEA
tara:strand:- start:682 stop:924 length:243 start_codon:yes stop_codon:yes gene_type:complete